MNETLTEYLLKQMSKLPVQQLREVIDFTEFLASRVVAGTVSNGQSGRALKSFAGGIDDELHGSSVR